MKKFKHKTQDNTVEFGDFINTRDKILMRELESNPIWKEIIEEGYEILSYQSLDNPKRIFRKNNPLNKTLKYVSGWYCDQGTHVDPKPDTITYPIHSIERLSDGEVFELGATAKTKTSIGTHIIRSFQIQTKLKSIGIDGVVFYKGVDEIWVEWDKDSGGNWLDKIEIVKDPIFTSEDGVEIFTGNDLFILSCNNGSITDISPVSEELKTHPFKGVNGEGFKYFSTKKATENYVLMNRVSLSLNDVFKIYPKYKNKEPKTLTNHAQKLIGRVKL